MGSGAVLEDLGIFALSENVFAAGWVLEARSISASPWRGAGYSKRLQDSCLGNTSHDG